MCRSTSQSGEAAPQTNYFIRYLDSDWGQKKLARYSFRATEIAAEDLACKSLFSLATCQVWMHQDIAREFGVLLQQMDRSVALALHQFRNFGRQVTTALRRDDAAFFVKLAGSISECLDPRQIRDFWKILRRSLPRFRQWLVAQDPQKLDQRAPYFQQLESGVECSAADLVNGCHNRQMAMTIVQKEFQCAELPSLIELEDALRATQADRPTGLDPLPSRLFSQQVIALSNGSTNPFRQKGGHGCDLQAWNWIRSSGLRIMLLPTLAN